MLRELTKRQKEVFDFITSYVEKIGFPPTINEIQGFFSFRSPNAVEEHLKALARKGLIKRHPYKSRGLEIRGSIHDRSDQLTTVRVPLVGRIAAGAPILAEENITSIISVDKSLVPEDGTIFALKVQGDSMIQAGIYDGDIAFVRQQSTAEQGEIVAALLGEEATIKKFHFQDGQVQLKPENDVYKPIEISEESDFSILGKVVGILRMF